MVFIQQRSLYQICEESLKDDLFIVTKTLYNELDSLQMFVK